MSVDDSKLSIIVPLTIALGVILSPESQVILGNGMGSGGAFFSIAIVLAVLAYFLTALSYSELPRRYPGLSAESELLRKSFGSVPATILQLSSRVLFAVCASTGILAVTGYVFNEVFVYWFPNLGFSFCLLGLLLLINLLGRKVTITAQITFVTVALVGLALLVVVGFLGLGNASAAAEPLDFEAVNLVGLAPVGLLLFIGHELALQGRSQNGESRGNPPLLLLGGIVLMGVIFTSWGLISLKYVSMQRLAGSTIPHMIAAREILGQNGRIIMGIVVISGGLGAVNGLLFSVSIMLSGMAHEGLLPSFFAGRNDRATATLLLLVFGIAAMMGLGMAGEPVLEIYTKAGILFWLLTYAAVHLAVLISVRSRTMELKESGVVSWHPLVSIMGLLIMLGGFRWLLWTDPNSAEIVEFMLMVSGVLFIFTASWLGFGRIRRNPLLIKIGKERINERTQTSDI
ncbi:MAG: APC family permease [Desulfobacterales bacterium]|nr:MAG: APC family permease [Desulfobacterales bacterium]